MLKACTYWWRQAGFEIKHPNLSSGLLCCETVRQTDGGTTHRQVFCIILSAWMNGHLSLILLLFFFVTTKLSIIQTQTSNFHIFTALWCLNCKLQKLQMSSEMFCRCRPFSCGSWKQRFIWLRGGSSCCYHSPPASFLCRVGWSHVRFSWG